MTAIVRTPARISALAASALLVVVALLTVLPLPSASAAPATCETSYSTPTTATIQPETPGFGYSVGWLDIQVPDTRVVVDIDFGFDVAFAGDSTELNWILNSPQSVKNVPSAGVDGFSGPLSGSFVLDDEAIAPFATPSPSSGRYSPSRPSAELDGHSAAGLWRLHVVNGAAETGTWGSFTLTLTVDCDADKDGTADDGDNCPAMTNIEQLDLDADGVGDVCDANLDGDGLDNASDGCQRIAAATASGCPGAERSVRLRHQKRRNRLQITVASYYTECQARAEVVVWRAKKGPDKQVASKRTSSAGRLALKAPRRPGRHYATVAESYAISVAECGAARSKSVRIRRNER